MDPSGRYEEHVAGKGPLDVPDAFQQSGLKKLAVLVLVHLALEAVHNLGIVACLDDVPHLGFAVLHAALLGQSVVGMHLDRELVGSVDKFNQQGELGAETVVIAFPNQLAHIYLEQFVDVVFGQKAVCNYRLVALDTRKRPQLAAVGQRGVVEAE